MLQLAFVVFLHVFLNSHPCIKKTKAVVHLIELQREQCFDVECARPTYSRSFLIEAYAIL